MTQARVQQNVLGLLRDRILPRAEQALELAGKDFAAGNVDLPAVLSAQRETLQVQVQVAQVEGELGKALASLERAVGCEFNRHPPAPASAEVAIPAAPIPPPTSIDGPFRQVAPRQAEERRCQPLPHIDIPAPTEAGVRRLGGWRKG